MAKEMIEVSEKAAVYNVAEDLIPFVLEPETFPVFWAWMKSRGRIKPTYSYEDMREDLGTVLVAIQGNPRVRR
jgi:hypothetical protein